VFGAGVVVWAGAVDVSEVEGLAAVDAFAAAGAREVRLPATIAVLAAELPMCVCLPRALVWVFGPENIDTLTVAGTSARTLEGVCTAPGPSAPESGVVSAGNAASSLRLTSASVTHF
jgi:hypothetical protein